MNRTIKFRAISKSTGLFVYGYLASNSKIYDPKTGITHDIISKTISQSTGLFDKNGAEIFEGDILQRHMKGGKPYKKLRVVDYWAFWNKSTFRNLEFAWESVVVGNIFENENLLKQPYANQR